MTQVSRILFVCLGNICRSPTAEGVARARFDAAGLDIRVDSAGTSDWHIGAPPYAPMVEVALDRGIDLGTLRARQVARQDFRDFDLIIAMDRKNAADLEALRPTGAQTPVRLLSEFANGLPPDIPDPYYTRDFVEAITLIERAVAGLHEVIAQK